MNALLLSLALLASDPRGASVTAVDVVPGRIQLDGPYSYAQLVVLGRTEDGRRLDLTRAVAVGDSDLVSVDERGRVRPLAEGRAVLELEAEGHRLSVPIEVRGLVDPATPDFVVDVQPVLSRLGCNAGTCHGNVDGKNGFKLSLRGYDPAFDFFALTDDLGGRRFDRVEPEQSLFLQKPAGQVPHEGGQLLEPDDPHYRLLRDWVADGARFEPDAARVERLELFPAEVSLDDAGDTQQFRVVALLEDGRRRDVTGEAFLESNDPEVVTVDADGRVSAVRRGEAAVLVRYEGTYEAARVLVMGDREGWTWQGSPEYGEIDRLVNAKLRDLRSRPAGLCTDAEFLRRVTLDLTGRIPSLLEVTTFLLDERDSRRKREELIDRLLGSPAFVEHWTNRWCDLLQVDSGTLGAEGARAMREWVRAQVASNRPHDRFVAELLGSEGSTLDHPAGNYWRSLREPDLAMEDTTQLFLGIRFNCNKCHDHPFERWTQDQHWQLAAFFARIGRGAGERPDEERITDLAEGEVRDPDLGTVVAPAFPYEHGAMPPEDAPRRTRLVAWLTSPENRYFVENHANRVWSYFTGVGLVEPVDDWRAGNPATNPELLAYLAGELVDSGFDTRHLMRLICRSHTYQRSIETERWNEDDRTAYAHAYPRRLPAEVLHDAVHQAAGVRARLVGARPGTRAAELVDPSVKAPDGFLDLFGRPPRESACECERSNEVSLGQALNLVNGATVADALAADEGAVASIARFVRDDRRALDELYLRFLGRHPDAGEHERLLPTLDPLDPENRLALDAAGLAELDRRRGEWEGSVPVLDWSVPSPGEVRSGEGAAYERLEDGSLRATGEAVEREHLTLTLWTEATGLTGLRLEALPDPDLPAGGPGRAENGNFVLGELSLVAVPLRDPAAARAVSFRSASADFSQDGWPVAHAIDGNPGTGWAVSPRFGRAHEALFEAAEDFGAPGGTLLVVTLAQPYGHRHTLGRLRLSVTASPRPVRHHGLAQETLAALRVPAPERSPEQRTAVHRAFLATAPDLAARIRRGALQDLAWALVNSPEFLFNR